MLERQFPLDKGGTVRVTFSYDPGDPSVGIGPGWGEDTCVEIKCGPIRTVIVFMDHGLDGMPLERVEDWLIDDVQTLYDHERGFSPIAWGIGEKVPRTLGAFPAVCEAVKITYEQWNAMEALDVASEDADWADAHCAELEWREREDGEVLVIERVRAEREAEEAKSHYERLKQEYEAKYGSS